MTRQRRDKPRAEVGADPASLRIAALHSGEPGSRANFRIKATLRADARSFSVNDCRAVPAASKREPECDIPRWNAAGHPPDKFAGEDIFHHCPLYLPRWIEGAAWSTAVNLL